VSERKQLLLRMDPAVHDALGRWATAELRSTTAHIEYLLRQALARAGRLPDNIGRLPRRGRPPKSAAAAADSDAERSDTDSSDTEPGVTEPGATEPGDTGASEPGGER
jgi:hypothetical protein